METRIEVGVRLSDELITQLRGVFKLVRERCAPAPTVWPVTGVWAVSLIEEVEPAMDGALDSLSLGKATVVLKICIGRRWIEGGELFLTELHGKLKEIRDALQLTERFGNDFLKRLAAAPPRSDDPVIVGDPDAAVPEGVIRVPTG